MENKKTFGAYILQRRGELGMTQKELAQKLFVTESAVSKWERGLSYPDITLVQNICSVLNVTEHELLSGSEDTSRRVSEKLAEKYRKLTRNYRLSQYIIYGLILIGCGIGNLAAQHRLDWFFIVMGSVMMIASLTLVPALAALDARTENYKLPLSFGTFLCSLEFLLLVCCIYSGGDWFLLAGTAVLFGTVLVFLPFLLPLLPLPPYMADRKVSVYLLTVTGLLLILLLVGCLYTGGDWFPVAAAGTIFGLSLFFLPVLLWQFPWPQWAAERKLSVYLLTETGLLLVLLLVSCIHGGGRWFLPAAAGVLFGLGLFFLPVILRQMLRGLPLYRHKALIYFALETILLLLILLIDGVSNGMNNFWTISLPVALLCLTLPWGIMGAVRYLPVNGWLKASVSSAWSGVWLWMAPWILDQILSVKYGEFDNPYLLRIPFDFSVWDFIHTPWNVIMIILIIFGIVAVLCGVMGLRSYMRNAKKRS
ncbi:MAG: helix-turn-helix domain-containing protein [Ruminococcus sp.]|jgi:transcriptional regulator with XRE-family HTH domain